MTLNVVMSKMVIDWFTGREVVLAMAIFVNSFPIGVGLAMLTLGAVSAFAGWQVAMGVAALTTLIALIAVWAPCEPHPNDAQVATWCVAASVQVGGLLGQGWAKPTTLMMTGAVAWSLCLLALAFWDPVGAASVILAGIVMGLPVGTIMAMPAEVLRPESRAVGMGYFYLWLYVGHGALPPVVGWVRDATGRPNAPIVFAAAMVLTMLALYGVFRYGMHRVRTAPVSTNGGQRLRPSTGRTCR